MTSSAALPPRIKLISRVDCHLCEIARATIEQVAAELGVGWVEVDVDADPELLSKYSDQVPVTLVDGRQHDFWRVDPARLRVALRTS